VAELRWILLGAGVALILILWWWETRKARLRATTKTGEAWPEAPPDSLLRVGEAPVDEEGEPSFAYAPTIERVRVPRRPPLIEIPDDLEVDVSEFLGVDRRRHAEPEFTLQSEPDMEPDMEPEAAEAANEEGLFEEEDSQPDDHHRAPWVSTQPLDRDEVAPKPMEDPIEPPPGDAIERRTAEASKQRIVALRLVAPGEGWGGAELLSAFEGEGLSFGPYSIFHREREDGKSLLFVASMMEPGSFDLARMEEEVFSGISLFGVVPGPLDAPSTFDLVLSVGRGLADRLKGQLQDEQGSTLTAQRILNLREDLVHFEHRNRRLRRT
jgi:cell division protein ZipA